RPGGGRRTGARCARAHRRRRERVRAQVSPGRSVARDGTRGCLRGGRIVGCDQRYRPGVSAVPAPRPSVLASEVAEFATRLRWGDIPEAVRSHLAWLMLDHAAVTV